MDLDRLTAEALRRETGQLPAWRWFVPGRIEIFGKHTDYAGGRSLLAAVPRGFVIAAGPRDDNSVRVIDARYGQTAMVTIGDVRDVTGWAKYLSVVVHRLARNFPGARLGADIAIASDLPRAAGLSSSSALVVGLSSALIRRAALTDRAEWREAIHSTLDLAGYLGAVENGLTFKSLASASGVGTHGGSEDHTAILTCREELVSAYSYVPVRHLEDAPMPRDWAFVIAASGIEADKAGSARDRYNHASLATRALMDVWNRARGESHPTLAAALASAPDAPDALRALVSHVPHPDFSAAVLARRLEHYLGEDARIPLAARAFRTGDRAAIAALADATQHDAEHLLGNQIPETVALARLARELGAFGASSFGAGFGGSVWALVDNGDAEDFRERWTRQYRETHSQIKGVDSFVARPGHGRRELGS